MFNSIPGSSHKLFGVQHPNVNSVISFRLGSQEDCTILVSNSNNKYRLQGSSYQALWLPLTELIKRLEATFIGTQLELGLEESAPISWYHGCIEYHFSLCQQRRSLLVQLDQAAAQVLLHFPNSCKSSVCALTAV
jgi:hypothetical protein